MGSIKAVDKSDTPNMTLTPMEQEALRGVQDAHTLAQMAYERAMEKVERRNIVVFTGIAQARGLTSDAFKPEGTHEVRNDGATWTVVEKPQPTPAATETPAENAAD